MNTEKAEKEIKELLDSGLNFEYEFDYNCVNKLNLLINKEGYSMKDIVSKLKDGERLIFTLNDGKTWNQKQGDDSRLLFNEKYENSIYWENKKHGDWVRVDSNMGSLQEWKIELNKLFISV